MLFHVFTDALKMSLDKPWQNFIDWSLRIFFPILLGVGGWVLASTTENSAKIREMDRVAFTIEDQIDAEKRHYEAIHALQKSINEMERRIPSRQEFDSLSNSIRDLKDEIRAQK